MKARLRPYDARLGRINAHDLVMNFEDLLRLVEELVDVSGTALIALDDLVELAEVSVDVE